MAVDRVTRFALLSGALACVIVGGSVPVTGMLDGYPLLAGQAMRYVLSGLVLVAWARLRRRPLPRPAPRDLVSLVGLAAIGALGFNACLLVAQRYAEPGFVAALLGGTPLVLALLAPLLTGRRPAPLTLAGAAAVAAGIVVLTGGGSWHGPGLLLAVLTMLCEAAFTLFAIGVVARIGAFAVATWCCLLAGALGFAGAVVLDGRWQLPSPRETLALLVLAVVVTAVGFCLWYRSVSVLGADRAGVLVGLMPVSGLLVSVTLGAQPARLVSALGVALVTAGCILGLHRRRQLSTPPPTVHNQTEVDHPTPARR
ncbi:DMT family transporter [Actinophytocola sp.]|uniref:DMT family transporter n=1 Tax=Actinophytocola sp. TaxID=1872138 RepID=UPI002D80B93B|nr:DMT family transporter [Actinophytocola sp.]HET9140242.1 DMT family transporter [Actinophytocola sp.]